VAFASRHPEHLAEKNLGVGPRNRNLSAVQSMHHHGREITPPFMFSIFIDEIIKFEK